MPERENEVHVLPGCFALTNQTHEKMSVIATANKGPLVCPERKMNITYGESFGSHFIIKGKKLDMKAILSL